MIWEHHQQVCRWHEVEQCSWHGQAWELSPWEPHEVQVPEQGGFLFCPPNTQSGAEIFSAAHGELYAGQGRHALKETAAWGVRAGVGLLTGLVAHGGPTTENLFLRVCILLKRPHLSSSWRAEAFGTDPSYRSPQNTYCKDFTSLCWTL